MSDGTASAQSHPQVVGFLDRMRWHQAVMRDGSLSQGAKLVAVVLSHHANDKQDRCDPSHARVSEMVCMDPSNVSKAISALSRAGWIRITTRKGGRNNYHLMPAESREPMALAPTPTLGADTTHPRRQRGGSLGASAKGPMAPAPYEPLSYQAQNHQEPEKTLNRPQANEVREGEVEAAEPFPGGDVHAVRHDALSGACEPPQGGVPDRAEGDQGEAEEVGDDEPFPNVPQAPAPVVTPVRKAPRRVTPEDFDISFEKLERMRRNLRKERGLDMWAMVEQQNDLFVFLPKWKRDDLLKKIVDEAIRANDNNDLARDAG